VPTPTATDSATTAPEPTEAATTEPTAEPTSDATAEPTSGGAVTPEPGSSLDPSKADSGIAGRLTIPDDTRPERIGTDDRTGTSEILGHADDGSDCSFSFSGDRYSAVAYYDDAPEGMLRQMSVYLPADEMPSNEGEQRTGITDGGVYADFNSESGFGTTYSGDVTQENDPGSATIDVAIQDGAAIFTFTGETWDDIAVSGQLICSEVSF
jgi:hypothetical protein